MKGKDNIKIPILMYHCIGRIADEESKAIYVSEKRFKKQMNFLYRKGYKTIGLEDLLKAYKENASLPDKPVIITFDDGDLSLYTGAFPILKSLNFIATIFLISSEKLRKGKLSPTQVKEMQDHGICFHSHTVTHPHLMSLKPGEVYAELKVAKETLEQELGKKVDFFAYPHGEYNEEIRGMVERAGYKAAVRDCGGISTRDDNIFELKRFMVYDRDTSLQFWLKLVYGQNRVSFRFLKKYYLRRLNTLISRREP